MQITEVKIKILNDAKKPEEKAVADVVFDNSFVVHGIKLIQTPNKYYIIMPSKKFPDGEVREQIHPIDTNLREYIKDSIVEEYLKEDN